MMILLQQLIQLLITLMKNFKRLYIKKKIYYAGDNEKLF